MNDTHQMISQKIIKLMRKKSAQERLMMGFSMFGTARRLILASLDAKHKEPLSLKERKKKLFLRFYGNDFSKEAKEKILNTL